MDIVKEHLSPDILEKYGPYQSIVQSEVVEGDDEGTTEPASDIPPEVAGKEEVEGEGDEETKEQADSNVEN